MKVDNLIKILMIFLGSIVSNLFLYMDKYWGRNEHGRLGIIGDRLMLCALASVVVKKQLKF